MSGDIPEEIKRFIRQNPNACGIKDKDSVFLYANDHYTRLVGLKHPDEVIGRTDFDMPCDTVLCAHLFQVQDQEVLASKKKLRIFNIHPFAGGEWKAYIVTKTPYIDSTGEIGGTIFHGEEITQSSILQFGAILARRSYDIGNHSFLSQNSYLLGSVPSSIDLSSRQKEVLFFLIRGHSLKKIASNLKISLSTIGEHVENLKEKFNAATKNDLIEKAVCQGFLSLLPDELSIKQLSVALLEF